MKIYFTVGILVSLLTMGCNKDYLKPKPLSFYTPENTYNKPGGLRAALVACERNMRHEYYGDGPPIITELIFSDVAIEGTTDKSGPAQDLNQLIKPDAPLDDVNHNRIGWWWREGFRGIKYANTVVTYIDEPNWDTTDQAQLKERNIILSSAYFQRAYRYFNLVNQFGDVPWIGKMYTEPKTAFYTVKREVILNKLKEDMEFAARWASDNVDKGEVTKGACLHLLTKINLALGDFDDAIESSSKLIDGGVYHLMTERFGKDKNDPSKNVIWDLHQVENKDLPVNTEGLLLVIDKPNMKGNEGGGMQIMRQCVPNWYKNIVTPNGNAGTTDRIGVEYDLVEKYGRGIGRCRPTWYSTNSIWTMDTTDLRHAKGNWMTMEDMVYNTPELKGKDPYYGKHLQLYDNSGNILCSDTIRDWFAWPHYKIYVEDDINSPPRGGNGDWYIYRLAETYLLRAEAYVWKGELSNAAKDINAVRERANAKPIKDPLKINIGTVLDERARELYYEELRHVVLSRIAFDFALTGKTAYNGKTYNRSNFSKDNFFYDRVMEKNNFYNKGVVTVHGDTYTMSPYHVLWPIPQSTIDGNRDGHINQNIGYDGAENNIPPLEELPKD